MGRFLRGCPLYDVRTSAVSPGADVMDGPLRKRAAMAPPNPLRPIADAADGKPSIHNDAAIDIVLTKGYRIFTQQQQYYYFVDSIRIQYATAECGTTERSAHDTEIEQQQTGQNTLHCQRQHLAFAARSVVAVDWTARCAHHQHTDIYTYIMDGNENAV